MERSWGKERCWHLGLGRTLGVWFNKDDVPWIVLKGPQGGTIYGGPTDWESLADLRNGLTALLEERPDA